jgi:hypothetical protein
MFRKRLIVAMPKERVCMTCRDFKPSELFFLSGQYHKKELRNTYGKTCRPCRERKNKARRVDEPKQYKQVTVDELLREFEADASQGE